MPDTPQARPGSAALPAPPLAWPGLGCYDKEAFLSNVYGLVHKPYGSSFSDMMPEKTLHEQRRYPLHYQGFCTGTPIVHRGSWCELQEGFLMWKREERRLRVRAVHLYSGVISS